MPEHYICPECGAVLILRPGALSTKCQDCGSIHSPDELMTTELKEA